MKDILKSYQNLHSERIIGVAITIAWIIAIIFGILSHSNIGILLASMLIAPLIVLGFIFGLAFCFTFFARLFS